MHDLQKQVAIFCVFNVFLEKTCFFCLNLFVSGKKNVSKNWFSLLFLFTSSSWFVLSLCVLSLCSLSLLLLFLLTKKMWQKSCVLLCSLAHFSPTNSFFFSGRSSFFHVFSVLFHSRKVFLRTNACFVSFIVLKTFLRKTLPYFSNESLSKNIFCVFLSSSFSSILFPSLLVFVHHDSHSPLFSFPLFNLSFYSSPSSWTQFLYLYFLQFFEQQFPLPFVSKKNSSINSFCMHALPLYVRLLIHVFICCLFSSSCFLVSITCVSLFLLLFSLSITFFFEKKKVCWTSANQKKNKQTC